MGFRVWGLGFRGLGLRGWGLGFRRLIVAEVRDSGLGAVLITDPETCCVRLRRRLQSC